MGAHGGLRQQPPPGGLRRRREERLRLPGFVPAYIRPLFCRGKGPFRWVALSGDPEDIRKTDAKMKELFPETPPAPLARHGRRAHRLPGPPARICWIGLGERHRAGLAFNEMVPGRAEGPIVIGRDHLDSGRWPRPNRETEAMKTAATPSPTGRC